MKKIKPVIRSIDSADCGITFEQKVDFLIAFLEKGGRTTKKLVGKVLKIAKVHVSMGNSKLGKIPNFNVEPMTMCTKEACETCGKKCYACNSWRQYPTVRKAWGENTENALFNVELLEKVLKLWFKVYKPQFFRIHSAGDFGTLEYTEMWFRIAADNPATSFLTYTKQWKKVEKVHFYELSNFSLKLSAWPGTEIPAELKKYYKIAYLIDENLNPAEVPAMVVCPGSCASCKACYRKNDNVGFIVHGFKKTPEQEKIIAEHVAAIVKIKP